LDKHLEIGTLIKVWNDGNQHLAKIKEQHSHSRLIHYTIIKTIYHSSNYNKFIHEEISNINNIVSIYGKMSLTEHQNLFPEDWI
jgi:hypothetical protein